MRKHVIPTSTYRDDVARSIAFSGTPHEYFARRKVEYLVALTERFVGPARDASVLDVGCGVGVVEEFLAPSFRAVDGVDIAADAIAIATVDHPTVTFSEYGGSKLPFADASFDVVLAACVLHHVEPGERARFVGEMGRVARAGGIVVVFEHNPYNPLTRFAVGRCECDDGAQLLTMRTTAGLLRAAGLISAARAYIIIHPFPSRRLQPLEHALRAVPIGSQYYAAFRPPARASTVRR